MSRRGTSFVILLAVVALAGALVSCTSDKHAAKTTTLVHDAKSDYVIVLGEKASPSEKRGAAELQAHLKQMSGAELQIVSDAEPLPKRRAA